MNWGISSVVGWRTAWGGRVFRKPHIAVLCERVFYLFLRESGRVKKEENGKVNGLVFPCTLSGSSFRFQAMEQGGERRI
jgi:hypothetical protein